MGRLQARQQLVSYILQLIRFGVIVEPVGRKCRQTATDFVYNTIRESVCRPISGVVQMQNGDILTTNNLILVTEIYK